MVEGVKFGDLQIPSLLSADDVVLLASSKQEIDRRIGAASAVMCTLKQSVVVKRELSQKAKLSIYLVIYMS